MIYHGILIDQEFKDKTFPERFKAFAKKQDGSWGIYGIEIEESELDKTIKSIQENMEKSKPWYAHFYNNFELIVIFKNKIFRVSPNEDSWELIKNYGKELNIPEEQLDFWPNRFQDEKHYFI